MKRLVTVFACIAGLSLATGSVLAHHGRGSMFDMQKQVTLKGTVSEVAWRNPHVVIYMDVKDESGAVKNYRIEMGPPYALARGGWKRDTLKIGDKVTVTGAAAAKDGSSAGGSMPTTSMTLADGQTLVMR